MEKDPSAHSNARRGACQAPADARPVVVLVRPREEGNVGAVARAMANMGLSKLLLVEPAPRLGGVARGFGVGGWPVLEAARRAPTLAAAITPFRRVIGTSAARGRTLGRARVLSPRELAAELAADAPGTPTALVFGPEGSGLSRAELGLCGAVVRIPCAAATPTLNLAQAVLILAYELHVARAASAAPRRTTPPATAEEVAGVLGAAGELVERAGFDQPHIHRALVADLRRLVLRAGASSREVRVLRRVVNRLLQRLASGDRLPVQLDPPDP